MVSARHITCGVSCSAPRSAGCGLPVATQDRPAVVYLPAAPQDRLTVVFLRQPKIGWLESSCGNTRSTGCGFPVAPQDWLLSGFPAKTGMACIFREGAEDRPRGSAVVSDDVVEGLKAAYGEEAVGRTGHDSENSYLHQLGFHPLCIWRNSPIPPRSPNIQNLLQKIMVN